MEPTGYEETAPIGLKHDAIPHVRLAWHQVTADEGPDWPRLHVDPVDASVLATGRVRKSLSRCDLEPTGYEDTAPIGLKHDAVPPALDAPRLRRTKAPTGHASIQVDADSRIPPTPQYWRLKEQRRETFALQYETNRT